MARLARATSLYRQDRHYRLRFAMARREIDGNTATVPDGQVAQQGSEELFFILPILIQGPAANCPKVQWDACRYELKR